MRTYVQNDQFDPKGAYGSKEWVHLVQVLDEAVEDGHKVLRGNFGPKDYRELVDRVGQRSSHLPLHVVGQGLVGFLWGSQR